ncbi:MAG TPA: rRNA maturation RNase YbeY [Candidatus Woesebacteria bacterium]|nr:rRNA maturation RNase YbeY [Candidatus Woesebacteria bacterium]
MIKVNLYSSSRYAVNKKKVRFFAEQLLKNHNQDEVQLNIWIVGQRKIKELNEKELHHQGTTDVLSFPQHEKQKLHDFSLPPGELTHLGEIVISFPEAVRSAKRYGKLVDDQLAFYVEHGLMHLLGYHHD